MSDLSESWLEKLIAYSISSNVKVGNKVRWFAIFLSLFLVSTAKGQVPVNPIGNNALHLSWRQINTDKIRVIFPEGSESAAQRVSNIVHHLWSLDDPSLGDSRHKASIVLQSESAISNGFVTVGPFRSEFFPSNRQFTNSTDYLDLLTIHEYRHINQFANATKGITKTVKSVLGSWAWGGMMATALPRWYFEGDAVISETNHTFSGRGRLPSFNMQYYALYSDGVIYPYEKAAAGSLKDYVPDWYPLGYNILSYGREHFGDDLWAHVVDDAVRYKGVFYPFGRSLKKRTGLKVKEMYDAALKDNYVDYRASIAQLELNDYQYLSLFRVNNTVVDVTMPHIIDGDTLVVRSAYDQLAAIERSGKGGVTERLCEIGRQLDGSFSVIDVRGSQVVWAEFANDIRRRYRQYSDIYNYNLDSGAKRRITKGKRYQSPALSMDEKRIAAIIVEDDLSQDLQVLSIVNGEVLHSLENKVYSQLSHPEWVDDHRIALVGSYEELTQLLLVDLRDNTWRAVTPPSHDQLSNPFYKNGDLYYSASYSGLNNIYKVVLAQGHIYKITEVPVGAFQPFVTDDNVLCYTELERKGMRAKMMQLEDRAIGRYEVDKDLADDRKFKHHVEDQSILTNLPDSTYEITKFNKWSGILNPHSVLAEFQHPVANVSLLSDNIFGTMSSRLGGSYNYNENEWSYFVSASYAELFPVINLSYVHGRRSAQFFNFSALTDTSSTFTIYNQRWTEDRLTAGLTIPLNLSIGNVRSGLNVSANFQTSKISLESNFDNESNFRDTITANNAVVEAFRDPIDAGRISTLDLRFNYFALKRQARLHLRPKIGVALAARLRKQLGDDLSGGDVFNLSGAAYFPGFSSTHSLYLEADYQKENVLDTYRYSDVFDYSRGYDLSLRRDVFFKLGINYSFPIWYPDKAIGPLAFVKRIKANAFFDYGKLQLNSGPFSLDSNMHSTGIELGIDFRALRLVEVDLGVRYSYLLNPELSGSTNRHQFDFFVISITQ